MCRITLSVILLFLSLHYAQQYQISADEENREADSLFNYLIFSQHWPVTSCKKWMHFKHGHCDFPKQKNRWTIHGTWPTRTLDDGPQFCNKSWSFDPEQIKSIEDDLNQAWINLYRETEHYSFWTHEWTKHGTCATDLESLNSEFKYFNQGIKWNVEFSLSDMLEAANIFPSDTKTYKPEDFLAAVEARTKHKSYIVCFAVDGVVYVSELLVCLDKQFNVIDCGERQVDENCVSSSGVIYPAKF